MKTNMLVFTLLSLLLCWIVPVDSMKRKENIKEEPGSIPLSMCEDSVDDRYSYCSKEMSKKVNETYFSNEMKKGSFRKAWNSAKKCTNRSFPPKHDKELTRNHIQAICVYTAGGNLFTEFNKAVRTRKNDYSSSFPFHSLHFWLTKAIQILSDNLKCHTTYRRTKTKFTGTVNQEIRFGIFASSSKLSSLSQFGKVTCFKIMTRHGAYLKKYPKLKDLEEEVLIPPYETFKITEKCETNRCKFAHNLPDCEIVYVVKSTGILSNLDCQLAKHMGSGGLGRQFGSGIFSSGGEGPVYIE